MVEVGKLVSRLGGKSVSVVDGDGFWLGFFVVRHVCLVFRCGLSFSVIGDEKNRKKDVSVF